MTRILLVALTSATLAAAVAAPALAAELGHGPTRLQSRVHTPASVNRMAPHHRPKHCTIRHHHLICD